jgi:5'-methylthioadenosine phosphorylase
MMGIIGGTGLYKMEGLTIVQTRTVETPFGLPSAPLVLGHVEREKVVFIPRHGTRHQLLPSEINYRANIWALKALGVRKIVGISAVGSLQKQIAPGEFVLPHQYFDWTGGRRAKTFFGDGLVAHISTAEPTCLTLRAGLEKAASQTKARIHVGKTYGCVEGPRLGTRAESHFLINSGCHLVGMTHIPEAFLAREAQLCYAAIAIATDYDCWLEDPTEHASLEKVMTLYQKSLSQLQGLLQQFFQALQTPPLDLQCHCRESLKGAVLTAEEDITEEKRRLLAFLRE